MPCTYFGMIPDGLTDWQTAGSGQNLIDALACAVDPRKTLYVVPGPYAMSGINLSSANSGLKIHFAEGAEIFGIMHCLSTTGTLFQQSILSAVRAGNVTTAQVASTTGMVTGGHYRLTRIEGGTTSFNLEDVIVTVVDTTHFSYPNPGANESATANTGIATDMPLRNVRFTGTLNIYDRFGTVNMVDSFFERVVCKNDPTKNVFGTKGRGAHITAATDNLTIESLIIEDCGAGINTDAAVAIEGCRNLRIGSMQVKKSDTHGIYITDSTGYIDELNVIEWGADAYGRVDGTYAQGSDGVAQCQELKGLWLNRNSDLTINTGRVSQAVEARPNAVYHVMLDETGVSTSPLGWKRPVRFNNLFVRNAKKSSVSFVDPAYPGAAMRAVFGHISIQVNDPALMTVGKPLLGLSAATTYNQVTVDSIRFIGAKGDTICIKQDLGAVLDCNSIEVPDFAGRILYMFGKHNIGGVKGNWDPGTGSLGNPIIEVNGAGVKGSSIGPTFITANVNPNTPVVRMINADGAVINGIFTTGFRSSVYNIWWQGCTRCSIRNVNMVSTGNVGTGALIRTLTDCHLQDWYITGFALGIDTLASVNTRLSAINCNITGNTTNTNAPAGTFATLNCTTLQLP